MKPVTVSIVKQALAPRPDDAHKGTMGTLLSICGCYGMAGACLLSSKAALRSGVGLLKCALPKSIYPIAAASIWESVYLPLEETPDGKTAAANLPFLRDQMTHAPLSGDFSKPATSRCCSTQTRSTALRTTRRCCAGSRRRLSSRRILPRWDVCSAFPPGRSTPTAR